MVAREWYSGNVADYIARIVVYLLQEQVCNLLRSLASDASHTQRCMEVRQKKNSRYIPVGVVALSLQLNKTRVMA